MRQNIEIIIPVVSDSRQLETTVAALEKHTSGYSLRVVVNPDMNVAVCRQKAMDSASSDIICFLDDDSEMIHDGWLDSLFAVMEQRPDAGAVFAGEWRGTDQQPYLSAELRPAGEAERNPFEPVAFGPSACMLIDRRRIPETVRWNPHIGLRSGWLGGDFEEVDYCYQMAQIGLQCYRATNTLFHHTGGKTTSDVWNKSDRAKTVQVMSSLVFYRYHRAPTDQEWFRDLQYVKADTNDDTMLAAGASLRDCYHKVIARNNLKHVVDFQQMGLV